jgi:8-amino-7-oxononanoate synthase
VLALAAAAGRIGLDATSNDYLGLAAQAASVSRETARAGSGAARLVQGTWPEHVELERELAHWVDQPAALLFSSGFAANLGTISALAGPDSVVLSDQLNHASIVDGCRLSRAQTAVIPHLNLAALETALVRSAQFPLRWVVTESYFSMDGDGPDLAALRALCDRYRAFLVVDEAHALGVFGPHGAGRCAEAGVRADALIGTLGKAIGTEGAFVSGSDPLRTWLWNRARSFVFSTAPSPIGCAITLNHVKQAIGADAARAALLAKAERVRARLESEGLALVRGSFGPIISVLVGTNQAAMTLAQRLRAAGILVQPIRPPTVPQGFARIRITISASHSDDQLAWLSDALVEAWKETCGASS